MDVFCYRFGTGVSAVLNTVQITYEGRELTFGQFVDQMFYIATQFAVSCGTSDRFTNF